MLAGPVLPPPPQLPPRVAGQKAPLWTYGEGHDGFFGFVLFGVDLIGVLLLREEGYFGGADGNEAGVLVVELAEGDAEDGQVEVGAHDDLLGWEVEDDDGSLLLSIEGAVAAGGYELLVFLEELEERYPFLVQFLELNEGILVLELPDVNLGVLSFLSRGDQAVILGNLDDGDGLGVFLVVVLDVEFGEENDDDLPRGVYNPLVGSLQPFRADVLDVLPPGIDAQYPVDLEVDLLAGLLALSVLPLKEGLDLLHKFVIDFYFPLAVVYFLCVLDQFLAFLGFQHSNIFVLGGLFDVVADGSEIVADDGNAMGPPQKLLKRYLALLGEVFIEKLLYLLVAGCLLDGIYFVGGVADVDQHEGDVLVVEETFLIEIENFEQKFHLLLEADAAEDDQPCEHLGGVDLALPAGVPHLEGELVGAEYVGILWHADGVAFADGFVGGVELYQFGVGRVE